MFESTILTEHIPSSTTGQPRPGLPATVLCQALPETDEWSKLKIAPKHQQVLKAKNTVFPIFHVNRKFLTSLTKGLADKINEFSGYPRPW